MPLVSRSVSVTAVFRPNDKDAISVLRLQAAVNDLGSLLRMVLHQEGTRAEINGASRYALRMGALHLNEIKKLVKKELPRLTARHFRRSGKAWRSANEKAREVQALIRDERLLQVIGMARQKFAGHYDADYYARALELLDRSDLMELPGRGVHYNVCDILFDQVFAKASHDAYKLENVRKSYEAALRAMLDLQLALLPVVNALVMALYADAEGR
jgi:hypothetical protein